MALGRTAKSTTGAHHCSSKPQPAGRVVASVKPSRLTTAVQVTARFDSHLNRAGAPAHRTLSSSGDSSSIAASAAASNWRTALDPSSGSNQGGAASWTPHSQGRSLAPTEARTNSLSSLRTLVVDGQDKEVMVRFCLKYRTAFGQSVRIIGSHPKLGAWSLPKALDLVWTEGDRWVATISLPTGCVAEYKYVLVDHDTKVALDWQNGSNSVLAIQGTDADVEVSDNWGNNPGAMVAANGKTFTRESKLQKWAEEMLSYRDVAREAQTELARQTDTLQAIKAQVARLKMEMGMANKAKQDFEMKILELEKENVLLKAQVAQSQMAMKSTLEEAIRLLAQDEEDQEREEEEAQAEEEAAAAAHSAPSSASSDNGNGSFFGSSPWSRDAQPAYSYSRNGTSSSSSYSQTRMQAPSMGASGSGTGSGVLRNWRQDLGGSLDASSASSSSSSFGSGVGSSQRSTGGADYWRTFS